MDGYIGEHTRNVYHGGVREVVPEESDMSEDRASLDVVDWVVMLVFR